jgi:hypothetical protein
MPACRKLVRIDRPAVDAGLVVQVRDAPSAALLVGRRQFNGAIRSG